MPQLVKLTARQAQLLRYLLGCLALKGQVPTRREIADHFGWSGPNAVLCHLEGLRRKGLVDARAGKARGIVLRGVTFRLVFDTSEAGLLMSSLWGDRYDCSADGSLAAAAGSGRPVQVVRPAARGLPATLLSTPPPVAKEADAEKLP